MSPTSARPRTHRAVCAALLAGVIAGLGLAPFAAAPAQAAAYCNMYPPSRVAVWQPFQQITVTYGEGCAQTEVVGARWVGSPGGLGRFVDYDGAGDVDDQVSVRDWDSPVTVRWRADGGWTRVASAITMNEPVTTIKFGSVAYVSAVRSNGYHEVTARAYHYSAAATAIVPSGSRPGQVQYRVPGSSQWRPVTGIRLDATGRAVVRTWSPGPRYYRVSFGEQPSLWGAVSAQVRAR